MSVAPAVRPRSAIRRWVRRIAILAAIGVIAAGWFVGGHTYRRITEARLLRETRFAINVVRSSLYFAATSLFSRENIDTSS